MTGILDAVAHAASFRVGDRVAVRSRDRGPIVGIESVAEVRPMSAEVVLGNGATFDVIGDGVGRLHDGWMREKKSAYWCCVYLWHVTEGDEAEFARANDLAAIRSALADSTLLIARDQDSRSTRYLTAQEARDVRAALESVVSTMTRAPNERRHGGVRRAGSRTVGYYDRVSGEYRCVNHSPAAAPHLVDEVSSGSGRAVGKACCACGVALAEESAK